MIELLSRLEVYISQRLDQIEMLRSDNDDRLLASLKDDQRKRQIIRNFRLIKKAQKTRTDDEDRLLSELATVRMLSRNQISQLEQMIVFTINRYTNSELFCQKRGSPQDIIQAFEAYFSKINATRKLQQMKVIRNLNLFNECDFLRTNLTFLLENIRTTLTSIFERQKNNVCRILKIDSRVSPQKRLEDDQDDEDRYGRAKSALSKKRKHQLYCYELSRVLNLEYIYIDYYYFNKTLYGGDIDKKRRILEDTIMKRNLEIARQVKIYKHQFENYGQNHAQLRQQPQINLQNTVQPTI